MPSSRSSRLAVALLAGALLSACGSTAPADVSTPTARPSAIPAPAHPTSGRLLDWTEFGLNPQRSDVSPLSTGITAANVAHLRRVTVALPGTVDSSPVYLHAANVAGAVRSVVVVSTTYGKTLALDANSGRILWTFTPAGYSAWAGSAQITTASPLLDPSGRYVYATSPNGLIHKLSLSDGGEVHAGGWPVSVTRDATHEKLGAALNIDGPYLLVATSGYLGDIPPYQGHVLLIDRTSGRIVSVFNTLCANRRQVILPSSCPASDSAILSRGGAVVEPGGGHLLISTGNGPWNGRTDFGDSVIELTLPGLRYRQAFTPTNQEELNHTDSDLGSSAPVLLGQDRAIVAGKDGVIRVLVLSRSRRRTTVGAQPARRRNPAPGPTRRRPAVHRTRRLAPALAHDRVHRCRTRHRRLCADRRKAASGLAEQHSRHEPGDGRRTAVRVRPGGRRGVRLRAALCSSDREAPRHRGPLEQPDRRRRPRDRARGRR